MITMVYKVLLHERKRYISHAIHRPGCVQWGEEEERREDGEGKGYPYPEWEEGRGIPIFAENTRILTRKGTLILYGGWVPNPGSGSTP